MAVGESQLAQAQLRPDDGERHTYCTRHLHPVRVRGPRQPIGWHQEAETGQVIGNSKQRCLGGLVPCPRAAELGSNFPG